MNEIFTIGDFCFRLDCPDSFSVPENFMKFQGGSVPSYYYSVCYNSDFPAIDGCVVFRTPDIMVIQSGNLEHRYIGMPRYQYPHAYYNELDDHSAQILFRPDRSSFLSVDPFFCSLFALERRQAELGAMVLHCAYVEYGGEAILFSAPSETGKTTQANLWEKYRGAKTVNGDRSLIQKINGQWTARGWPVCGSSGVCCNRDLPIRAVVMLSQAPEDRAGKMAPASAFSQLYSQITVNRWNRKANLDAMDRIEDLIQSVPVFHLACTMNESAVIALENALFPERNERNE